MARDANGNYTLPAGNPVAPGTVISTTWANPTLTDIAQALTDSLSRNGDGGMLVAFENVDGNVALPGITWTLEPATGLYREATNDMQAGVAGSRVTRWFNDTATPNGEQNPFQIWDGLVWRDVLRDNYFDPITFRGLVTMSGGAVISGAASTSILKVSATGGDDALSFTALAAGSGGIMAALDDALNDYEPLRVIGESIQLEYRTGAGTSASGLTIASTGAATFSGDVTVNSHLEVQTGGVGETASFGGDDASGARALQIIASTTTGLGDTHTLNATSSTGVLQFATQGLTRLTIGTTGVATFSGNVAVNSSKVTLTNAGGGAQFQGSAAAGGMYFDSIGAATDIIFRQTGAFTERMRIDASGTMILQADGAANLGRIQFSGQASTYQILGGNNIGYMGYKTGGYHRWFGSNTAEKMRLDNSGNLGVGVVPSASAEPMIEVGNAGSSFVGRGPADTRILSGLYFDTSGTFKYTQSGVAAGQYQITNGGHSWSTAPSGSVGAAASPVTGMVLDASGHLLLNEPTSYAAETLQLKCLIAGGNSYGMIINGPSTNNTAVRFFNTSSGSAVVGSITFSATATAYNTSSDYRLKEDAVPMTGATERVKALRPINFAWKADGSRTDGFFAHEAQEVVPEAATGTKDAMRDEEYEVTPAVEEARDEDDNVTTEAVAAVMGTRSVPDYQGIDQSKLVPLLTATIQELIARIEALEGA